MHKLAIGLGLALSACTGSDKPTDGKTDTDTDTGHSDTSDTGDGGTTITVPTPTGDPATVPLAGECSLDTKYGAFAVQVLDYYSTVAGSVADGVVPITVLEEMSAEGDCHLLRRNNAFCDPPCQADETCDFDGSCIPFPANQNLGTVTVGGLVDEVLMEPVGIDNNADGIVDEGFQYFKTQLAHPAFTPGSLIELRTWNTAFGEDIELHGVGVAPLDLGSDTNWLLFRNQDHVFTWTPSPESVRASIQLRLNIDQHGNTPVSLYCDFDDSGSATVPASLITELIDFGVTGFPNATITRRTVDSTTMGGGCVQFEVSSPASPDVQVDGFVPCDSPDDCPTGQTCNLALQICE